MSHGGFSKICSSYVGTRDIFSDKKLTTFEEIVETLKSTKLGIRFISSLVESLTTRLDEHRKSSMRRRAELKKLLEDYNALKERISHLEEQINTLRDNISTIRANGEPPTQRMSNAIEAIEKRLNELWSSHQDLIDVVNSMEIRIESLEKKVDKTEDTIDSMLKMKEVDDRLDEDDHDTYVFPTRVESINQLLLTGETSSYTPAKKKKKHRQAITYDQSLNA